MMTKNSIGGVRGLSRSRRLAIEPLEDRNLLSGVPAADHGLKVLASSATVDWDTVLCDNQGELFGIGLRAGSRGLDPLYLGEMESGGVPLVMDDMAYSPLEDCYYGVTLPTGVSTSLLYRVDIDTSALPLPEVDVTFIGQIQAYVDGYYLPVFFNSLEFSNDGSTLFAAGAYGIVSEHDCTFMLNTGTALATLHKELTVGAEFYHSAGDIEFDYNGNMYVTTRDEFATTSGALLKIADPLGAPAISRVGYTGLTDLYGLTFGPNFELIGYSNGETAGDTPVYSIDLADAEPTLLAWIDDAGGELTGVQGAATTLGPLTDTIAPTALLNAPDLSDPGPGGWTYSATVIYSDDEAVIVSSLDSDDIWVTGPGGAPLPVTYAGVDPADNGTPRSASYEIAAPGGTWDMSDNGVYTVFMQSDEVVDIGGNHVAAGTLGTFTVRIVDPLGPITAFERTGLDPSAGDLSYSCQASCDGILSIEAIAAAPGTLEIVLCDENLAELATSTVVNGNQRIDLDATAGETFYFKLRGTCTSADLHLVNLLHVGIGGGVVTVAGTDGPDLFQAMIGAGPAGTHVVLIDGMYYDSAAFPGVTNIHFDAGAGTDSVEVEGGGGVEEAILQKNYSQISSTGILLETTFAEQVRFTAGPGADAEARLYDSPGADTFQAWPDHATMTDSTGSYLWEVFDVDRVYGYADAGMDVATFVGAAGSKDEFIGKTGFSSLAGADYYLWGRRFEQVTAIGQDSVDLAKLYDGPDNDALVADPTSAKLNYDGSPTDFVEATTFGIVQALATNAAVDNDTAKLYDSAATEDKFVAEPDASRLYGPNFYNRAKGFETVDAYASGLDRAKMYDSLGDDIFSCGPDFAAMQYDGGPLVRAHDFPYAFSFAYAGGNDTANMHDAAATADRLKCKVNYGKLYGPGFFTKAISFEKLTGTATPGQADVAQLYDRLGNDLFEGTPTATKLKFDGLATTFVEALDFRYAHGFATKGGDDTATLQDAAATADKFEANSDQGMLYNDSDFYVRAKYFDRVTATATPGQDDVAMLYDGTESDVFDASPTTAKMSYDGSPTHFTQADGFRYVHGLAYASDTPGAVDKAFLTDSAGDDTLEAYPDYSKLYNNTVGSLFYSRARLFDEVHADGGALGEEDYAYLYDSAGADELEYSGSTAQVSSTDFVHFLNEATAFKHIRPSSTLGGTDTKIPGLMLAGYDLDDSAWL